MTTKNCFHPPGRRAAASRGSRRTDAWAHRRWRGGTRAQCWSFAQSGPVLWRHLIWGRIIFRSHVVYCLCHQQQLFCTNSNVWTLHENQKETVNCSMWAGPAIAGKSLEHWVYLHGSWIVAHGGHRPDHLMQEREVAERTQLSIVGCKDKDSTSGVNQARERSARKDCSHRVYPPWNGRGNILLTRCWPAVSMHHRMGAAPCWPRSRTHSLLRTRPPLLSAERGEGTEYKKIKQRVSKESH